MRIQDSSTRWLTGIAVLILFLIALSVAVTLLNREEEATLLAEDTPEGTVQRYLLAIEEGDIKAAYEYLGSGLQEECTISHLRDTRRWVEAENMGVSLQGTRPFDGEVEVEVLITRFYVDPPFGSGESSNAVRYMLAQEDGNWRFVDPPYPMEWCPERVRPALPPPAPPTPEFG